MHRRRLGFIAVAALFIAFAWPMQGGGPNELSHYALIKALAQGTAEIDETRLETGDHVTGDVVRWHGHWYSNKAPGLAFLTLPTYLGARAIGISSQGDPTTMLWVLSLVGAALPALVLLLLASSVAERLAAGTGTAVAVVLGGATLLLPFATVLHAHVLAATLVFAAFASLLLLRQRAPAGSAALAGLLIGFAVGTEYATGLAALVLGSYVAMTARSLRAFGAYLTGLAVGLVPVLAYNEWAFGSVSHFSWAGATSGNSDRASLELAGRGAPDLDVALESLFGFSGLVTSMPVLVLGAAGVVLLARREWRAEAVAVAALVTLFVLFNASYGTEFDSYRGGERYLIVTLPFLLAPLGLALRRWPVTTGALTIVSAVLMAALASSNLRSAGPDWLGPLADRRFSPTILSFVDVTGWYGILPFFAALVVAAAAAIAVTPRPHVRAAEVLFAGAAVLGWAVLAAYAPQSPRVGGSADSLEAYLPAALVGLALAFAGVFIRLVVTRSGVRAAEVE